MPARLLAAMAAAATGLALTALGAPSASAIPEEPQYGSTGASVEGGGVIVGASTSPQPSASPQLASTSSAGGGHSTSGASALSPCTYTAVEPSASSLLGPGGPTSGSWVYPFCVGQLNPMPPVWVAQGQTPGAAPGGPVSPAALAHQALSRLALPTGQIHMSPPVDRDQIVHLPTWLWVDPGTWRTLTATASAGPVSATATAAAMKVVWDMGDGGSVTCSGPGTPYDPHVADADQHSDCTYSYGRSSVGQPGGTFAVTATAYFHATWAATGAPGGGDLGVVAGPPARVSVRVAEAEALNTS